MNIVASVKLLLMTLSRLILHLAELVRNKKKKKKKKRTLIPDYFVGFLFSFFQIDFVYVTGDLPAHNVWNQSRDDQTTILREIAEFFLKYLPGIKVYHAVGNHESAPVNR